MVTVTGRCGPVSSESRRAESEGCNHAYRDYEAGTPSWVELSSPEVKLAAGQAEITIRETTYLGKRLTVTVQQAKQVFEKLETVATRILERATDVYRQVENLQQLKAGRMRVLIKGTCHIKGGRTSIRADDDVKIGGRRIHLG